MRKILFLVTLAPLAACLEAGPAQTDLPERQTAACTAAIAAHINRPSGEITSRWLSQADGIARVEARDGNRLHICNVDAMARVLSYEHPNA